MLSIRWSDNIRYEAYAKCEDRSGLVLQSHYPRSDRRELSWRIRSNNPPSPLEMAKLLGRCNDPVLTYVAGLLDGTIKQKAGRKRNLSPERLEENYILWEKVNRCQAAYERWCKKRHINPVDSRGAALECVGRRYGIPKDTLDKRTRSKNRLRLSMFGTPPLPRRKACRDKTASF
jgi:hypothetical protein